MFQKFSWPNRKNLNFTKITLVKLIFSLAKRDWYQIVQKSILFSYNNTNNELGEGQKWSKFKILGNFGQKTGFRRGWAAVGGEKKIVGLLLYYFCLFCWNHLTIPWNKWNKCKNHEPEPSELTAQCMLRSARPIIPLTECWWYMKVLLKLLSWSEFLV